LGKEEEETRKSVALVFNPAGKLSEELLKHLQETFYVSEKRDVLDFYHELASSSPEVMVLAYHPPYTLDLLKKIGSDPRYSRVLTVVVDPKGEDLKADLTVSSSEPEKAVKRILERLGGKL